MTRQHVLAAAAELVDSGRFRDDLARRVAIPSTAQDPEHRSALYAYLNDEIGPTLAAMGYVVEVFENPVPGGGPLLVGRRHEGDDLPTVLTYGHGDVVRGLEGQWRAGLDPWTLTVEGDRWYGRGTADNKSQHSINLAALATVIDVRGRLGFNSTVFIDMSEEIGSPGLREFAEQHRSLLAADVLIGSDGPRLVPEEPTVFLGTRGAINFELSVDLRDGGHHSGNWGGLIANAGTRLANAIAALVGPSGEILVDALKPESIPDSVRAALATVRVDGGPEGPKIDEWWGEPGLTPVERVFAWNTFEVLSFVTGNPAKVVNAIPPTARAWCQIRFTVDRDPRTFLPTIREHLDHHGFSDVVVEQTEDDFIMEATRLLPDHPWVQWAARSIEASLGRPPMVVPNLGGSLPNDVFADVIGVPTVWVPHSYAACSQHAPNEHVLEPLMREGLAMMTGLFWDAGDPASRPAAG
ncbi:MAG: M20 family metallopeptidase [Actinomycetota bacterium]